MRSKPRVLVCGTNYGRFYLSAFIQENCGFELAGILATGSARSQALAKEFGVPLYSTTDQLPVNIDFACVAVKSTLLGGAGTRIALELLRRGIHVVQEHPLHSADLAEVLRLARQLGLQYHVNSNFVHVGAVQIFMDYVCQSACYERPRFIDLTTALPYSALDIVGQALGTLEPFNLHITLEPLATSGNVAPFCCLGGEIAGIPVSCKVQNYFDPDDSLHNYLVMHRICIGAESGNVSLLNPFGPVIWTQGYPRSDKSEQLGAGPATVMAGHFGAGREAGTAPTSVQFTAEDAPSYGEIFSIHWPRAILHALETLHHAAERGETPPFQQEGYLTALARAWVEVMRLCGKPVAVPRKKRIFAMPDPVQYRDALTGSRGAR